MFRTEIVWIQSFLLLYNPKVIGNRLFIFFFSLSKPIFNIQFLEEEKHEHCLTTIHKSFCHSSPRKNFLNKTPFQEIILRLCFKGEPNLRIQADKGNVLIFLIYMFDRSNQALSQKLKFCSETFILISNIVCTSFTITFQHKM